MFLPSLVFQRELFSCLSAKTWYYSLRLTLFHPSFLQSTRVEFDLPEYSVRRRYQDFDWLRNKLEESQPTHLIPVGTKSLSWFLSFPALSVLRVFAQRPPYPPIRGTVCLIFYTAFPHQTHVRRFHGYCLVCLTFGVLASGFLSSCWFLE